MVADDDAVPVGGDGADVLVGNIEGAGVGVGGTDVDGGRGGRAEGGEGEDGGGGAINAAGVATEIDLVGERVMLPVTVTVLERTVPTSLVMEMSRALTCCVKVAAPLASVMVRSRTLTDPLKVEFRCRR